MFTIPLHIVSESLLSTEKINGLCQQDMAEVNQIIRQRLQSDVALVSQLGHYIIDSGGKRFRPLLVLLSARAHGYQGQLHFTLAAIIEFIHTATLLHDDVVDESSLRRGKETANELFGNAASVLVGAGDGGVPVGSDWATTGITGKVRQSTRSSSPITRSWVIFCLPIFAPIAVSFGQVLAWSGCRRQDHLPQLAD